MNTFTHNVYLSSRVIYTSCVLKAADFGNRLSYMKKKPPHVVLKELREAVVPKMTLEDLATKMNAGVSTVHAYELGTRGIKPAKANKLSKIFNVPAELFLPIELEKVDGFKSESVKDALLWVFENDKLLKSLSPKQKVEEIAYAFEKCERGGTTDPKEVLNITKLFLERALKASKERLNQ